MKNRINTTIALVLAVVAMTLGACTENDGDKTGLYGLWHLTEAKLGDAVDATAYEYAAFQNNVVKLYNPGGAELYGRVTAEGDRFRVDYVYPKDDTVEWIVERNGDKLVLTSLNADDSGNSRVWKYEKM